MKFLLTLSAVDLVQIQQQRQRRLRVLRQQLDTVDREQTQLERKGVDLEQQLRSKVCYVTPPDSAHTHSRRGAVICLMLTIMFC